MDFLGLAYIGLCLGTKPAAAHLASARYRLLAHPNNLTLVVGFFGLSSFCHLREGGDPFFINDWTPAFAGVTNKKML
jgi:hypothetical protein